MRHLIIPDVHDKVERAQYILDHETYDRVVFLGDYFDDFRTGVSDAENTARYVLEWMRRKDTTLLLGNHDYPYGWALWNAQSMCSGWTPDKHKAINKILAWHDWKQFKLHYWADDTHLLSHAGFHRELLYKQDCPVRPQVDNILQRTLDELHGSVNDNPFLRRPSNRRIMEAGRMRGGDHEFGGIIWCDFSELDGIPGINQVVGHTARNHVRMTDHHSETDLTRDFCIDTHLEHYAILDNGSLSIVPVTQLANGPVKVAEVTDEFVG
jgi:hypothetical protein